MSFLIIKGPPIRDYRDGRLGGRQAESGLWRPDRLPTACFDPRDDLALQDTADTERVAAQSQATFLVRPAVAADVLGPSGNAPARIGILARSRPIVPSDHGPLFSYNLGTLPAWRSPLDRQPTSLPC